MIPGDVVFWRDGTVIRSGYVQSVITECTHKGETTTLRVSCSDAEFSTINYLIDPSECVEYYELEVLVKEIRKTLRERFDPKPEPVKEEHEDNEQPPREDVQGNP